MSITSPGGMKFSQVTTNDNPEGADNGAVLAPAGMGPIQRRLPHAVVPGSPETTLVQRNAPTPTALDTAYVIRTTNKAKPVTGKSILRQVKAVR